MTNLRKKTFSGVRWTTLSSLGRAALQVGQIIILARLLMPSEFGTIAIVLAITAFLQIFADAGVSNAIVHFNNITREELSSLFWLNVGISIMLAVLMVFLSPLVALWYREPVLVNLLFLAATSLVLLSFGQQLRFKAQKELQFAQLAKLELCAAFCAFVTAILLAWYGAGVYALSIAGVVNSAVGSLIAWLVLAKGWRPQWRLHFQEIRRFLSFGVYMVGNNLTNTFNSQVDVILGARLLGAHALGMYSVSKNLTLNVQAIINPIVTQVGFPIMAKAQDDIGLLRRIYLQTMRMTASVNFPIYIGLLFFAPFVVEIMLGKKWEGSVSILRILSVWGLFRSTINPIGSLLFAKGRADLSFKWNLVLLFLTGPTVWLGSNYGVLGMASAVAGLMIMLFVPNWYFLVRATCGAGFKEYAIQFISPFFASLSSIGLAYILSSFFSNTLGRLITGLMLGAIFYVLISFLINRVWVMAMIELLLTKRDSRQN